MNAPFVGVMLKPMAASTLKRPVPSMAAPVRKPARRAWQLAVQLVLCLLIALVAATTVHAQASAPAEDADKVLDSARKQMDSLRKGLHDQTDDAELLRLRAAALEIQSQGDATAERLTPLLASVQARLTELGPVAAGAKEAPDVAGQRAQLEKTRTALDSQIKLAKLLAVEGAQTAEQVSILRRSQFQARLGERRESILGTIFWSEFRGDFPRDLVRLQAMASELTAAAQGTPGWAWAAVAAVLAIVLGLWVAISRVMMRLTATRVPAGRLRRSFHALTIVMLATAAPGLIAELLHIGLAWGAQLSEDTEALIAGWVGIVCFGGFVSGLGVALLEPRHPSWRLLDIPDMVAQKMRWLPLALGPLVVLTWVLEHLPASLNASLSTTMAVNCLVALILGAIIACALVRLERVRRVALRDPDSGRPPARPLWLVIVVSLIWIVLTAGLLSVLTGYVAFGNFVTKQVVWTLIVLSAAYLLTVLVEDFFTTVLGSSQRKADADQSPHEPRIRDQAAVLLSGVGRLFVIVIALVMLLGQFGEGPMELLQRANQLRSGLSIGAVQLRPAALLQAVLVLGLGLLAVRILKRWLTSRYLPTTTLDPGMQVSASTLFGYAGVVTAVALALSALGIGLERVAWVASALSVGIGFGLQAVVQNFVSGLILLAERPVKVGDWVSLGGVEGDIRRINVRATEIQMGDRSTLIVPNSEFITKTVRNVTHANPLGLVQIKLPMPLTTDADKVRQLMLDAYTSHEDILETPAPNVFLDGIDGGNLIFNATGYVSSPRQAYVTRSALLFDILKRVAEAGLSLGQPPTMLISAPPAAPASLASPPPAGQGEAGEPPAGR